MNKIKAKLMALLMAVGCLFACVGVATANLSETGVKATAATTEELTAEFTNNGQFAVAMSAKSKPSNSETAPFTILDGSAAQSTLPAGYSGAVLEIYHSGSADGYDFVTLDFTASQISAVKVESIVVRIWVDNFNSGIDEFRTIGSVTGTQRQYGTSYDLSTWCDITLNANSIADMKDANGYLSAIDLGIRDKSAASHLYIDSVTVTTASYTEHNLKKLAVNRNSNGTNPNNTPKATQLYMQIADGTAIPYPDKDWNTEFVLESGEGWKLNGNVVNEKISDIESTNAGLFVNLANTGVQVGDVLSVEGTFYSADVQATYIIAESKFTWNGTAWENVYTTYDLGKIKFNQVGNANKQIYFKPVSGTVTKADDGNGGWTAKYSWKEGEGVTINGSSETISGVKFPGSIFVELKSAPNVGDIMTIGGELYNNTVLVKYTIEETQFQWNGTAWVEYVPFTTYELGALTVHNNSAGLTDNTPSAGGLYMKRADGQAAPIPEDGENGWNTKFALESGEGWKLNGNSVTVGDLMTTNSGLYVNLSGANVQMDDVLTVSGTFTSATANWKLVVEESTFIWNGTAWERPVEYTATQQIGRLKYVKWTAAAKQLYVKNAYGEKITKPEDGEGGWTAKFLPKYGVGVTLNGEKVKLQSIKFPSNEMFIHFDDATVINVGDVVTIGGTFYNMDLAIQYTIEETSFTWNGETWEKVYEITTSTVTQVGPAGGTSASVLYLYSKAGDELPKEKGDWDNVYTFEAGSGEGVKLNDTTLNPTIKLPGDLYVPLGTTAVAGDVFTIDGIYYSEAREVKLIFENCKLTFDGTNWVEYVEFQYETIEIATVTATSDSSAKALYLAGGFTKHGNGSWDYFLTFEEGSGVGIMLNGTQINMEGIKIPTRMYVPLGTAANVGDVVTIEGTFYNKALAVKYVIAETKLEWNGATWMKYVENYDTYTVTAIGGYITDGKLYAYSTHSELPPEEKANWDDRYLFIVGSGEGMWLNDEAVTTTDLKLPGDFYIGWDKNAVVGDVFTIDGTYVNPNNGVKIVFSNCKMMFNGERWESYIEYTTYELGQLAFSKVENENKHTYFGSANGTEIPADADLAKYSLESGAGVKINNADVEVTVQFPGTVFLGFTNAPNVGDKLTISGTFYNEAKALKYVIEETTLWWNGEAWVDEKVVVYETIEISTVTATRDSSAAALYLTGGFTKNDNEAWKKLLTFKEGSGVGITLNGTAIDMNEIKVPGNYIWFPLGTTANIGDVVTIAGTFYNEELAVEYVIAETSFQWMGKWEVPVDYTTIEIETVTIGSASSAKALYLYGGFTKNDNDAWKELLTFANGSGVGVTLNGVQINMNEIKVPGKYIWFPLGTTANPGDIVTIEGIFYNINLKVKYVIAENNFMYNGTKWQKIYADDMLADYDVISLHNINMGMEWQLNGTVDDSKVSKKFAPSVKNTTNSVAFRFDYTSTDVTTGTIDIRLRGDEWNGFHFKISESVLYLAGDQNFSYSLESNTDYAIEIAAIDMADGNNVWVYIKINGLVMASKLIERTASNAAYATNHVSLWAANNTYATLTDTNDTYGFKVTYVSTAGSYNDTVMLMESLMLPTGKTTKTFIGWVYNGKLYQPGEEFGVLTGDITFTALEIDFAMEDGAAIRVADSADSSGIRFTSKINEAELNALIGKYGITNIAYGTLIMPYDYLAAGDKPNLEEYYTDATEILKIPSAKQEQKDGYLIVRGAMQNLYEGNYGRLFAGRAYMEITFTDGEVLRIYTAFDNDDNVRSIRQIAIAFKADTSAGNGELRYNDLSAEQKAVVDAYIAVDGIRLMNYDAYESNVASVIAWNYPKLDASNNYDNATNDKIVQTMIDSGVKVVGLTGQNLVFMKDDEGVEKTRRIINYFWSKGLYTFAFAGNTNGLLDNGSYKNMNVDLSDLGYPDFSDCEGFMGFLAWDEPLNQQTVMDKLAAFAVEFEKAYAGTDVIFMTNLLPSYAGIFNEKEFWENIFGSSGIDVLKKDVFKAYLQQYCDTVLSKVSGTKWLSLDTYPINEDYSLTSYFLFDLAMLKYYAEQEDAHSHVVLQSSGWVEGGKTGKSRIPTEAEMRMQVYAAMAFGIDSFSWFTYSPSSSGDHTYNTPVGNNGAIADQTAYDAFTAVNEEVNLIGKVYNAFDWKGVILGASSKSDDYKAYNAVKGEIGDYELTAADTNLLASVSNNNNKLNYLMGVMEDAHGNEGYVLCNYNSHEEDRAQTITLTFDANVTEVVIYRGGVKETISVSNKTLAVTLATGEGVIILPSKLG